jgi:hypothetical protein
MNINPIKKVRKRSFIKAELSLEDIISKKGTNIKIGK